jgi:hypothetical protein
MQSKCLKILARVFVFLTYLQRQVLLSNKNLNRFVSLNSYSSQEKVLPKWEQDSQIINDNEQVIYRLSPAYLETKYLHIRNADGRMLSESTNWPDSYVLLSRPTCFNFPIKFYQSIEVSEPIIALSSEAYYHWLIEQLPVFLRIFNSFPHNLVVYNEDAPKYVLDILDILGVDSRGVGKFVRVENLLFTPHLKSAGSAIPRDVSFLRDYFNERFGTQRLVTLEKRIKVYISRRNSTRSPAFESVLESYLTKVGWCVILAENLSLLEQYSTFSKARVVMGLHGAGLSNIAFMPEKGEVIEIRILIPGHFHGDYISNCYENLSAVAGHSYRRIQLRPQDFDLNQVPPEIAAILEVL